MQRPDGATGRAHDNQGKVDNEVEMGSREVAAGEQDNVESLWHCLSHFHMLHRSFPSRIALCASEPCPVTF